MWVTRSSWKAQSAPICQVTVKPCGASYAVTTPVSVSEPSVCLVYQRPPTNGSMTTFSIGASPMWWPAGHHDVISSVKTSKQRFWSRPTETLTRTG